jgi:PTS system mannose-specific IIB component/fructoselysine and glucoselysine-specific PTS system IIB component
VSIVLYRVDERLIHGQVVLGWGNQLRPDRFIVVDDEVAASEWEQELYRLGAGQADVLFVGATRARASLSDWQEEAARSVLLTRDLATMRTLAREGDLGGREVNVGGIHHGPGRTRFLSYVHLSDEDRADVRALAEAGVEVTARDLPDSAPVSLPPLLDR